VWNDATIACLTSHSIAGEHETRDIRADTIRLILGAQNFKLLQYDSSCHYPSQHLSGHSIGCSDFREVFYQRVLPSSLIMHANSTQKRRERKKKKKRLANIVIVMRKMSNLLALLTVFSSCLVECFPKSRGETTYLNTRTNYPRPSKVEVR